MGVTLQEKKKIVFPGEPLAVIEEYRVGQNTHEENGIIKASVFGTPIFNDRHYVVKILPKPKTAPLPQRGDYVLAQVVNTGRQVATIHIYYLNGIETIPPFTGLIHISMVTNGYLETIEQAFKTGDVIRAKVVDTRTIPLHLETLEPDCGVVYGLCSNCGSKLSKRDKSSLQCEMCGNIEPRKVAIDYGTAGKEIKT